VEDSALLITKERIVFVFNMNKRKRNRPGGYFNVFGRFYFLRSFYFLNLFALFRRRRWDSLPFLKIEGQHQKISTEREEK
jgi:hypothetical protein